MYISFSLYSVFLKIILVITSASYYLYFKVEFPVTRKHSAELNDSINMNITIANITIA